MQMTIKREDAARAATQQREAEAAAAAAARETTEAVLEEEFGSMSFADLLAQEKEDAEGGEQGALPVKHNLFYGEKY